MQAGSFTLPVANIAQLHVLDAEIQTIEKLEKLKAKEKAALEVDFEALREKKASFQVDFEALQDASRMWFETLTEFKPRMREAVVVFAAEEKERKEREEEEGFKKKLEEEAEALEKKRLEAAKKEEEKARKLEEKMQAKKLEAAAKPVKEAPPKPVKEKQPILPAKPKEKKMDDSLAMLADEKDELWETLAQQEAERKAAEE